ncbi:ArsI/CadI family heavy metal resistance metalloenzyme [Neobacillus dielmonensis]|uniref:ArsI/CadI family heavy metal resistance metalloenzyme n=1 Tax=Neobacillus dielmonensis TaxID=1347369 RepID=UPI0005AA9793|nr:ArsI/CadI family heavy metal resistance metalloenzyme [Neobacillus dielmonensis]
MNYAHIGLNVTNLEKSLDFYTKLFGTEPVKVKPDYAKFLLEKPGLNFTLNLKNEVSGNQVGHFGIQVDHSEDVIAHKNRLEQSGILSQYDEMNTTCCYALQDKFWVQDPDGNEWEFFYTKGDVEQSHHNEPSCCTTEPKTDVVECCS